MRAKAAKYDLDVLYPTAPAETAARVAQRAAAWTATKSTLYAIAGGAIVLGVVYAQPTAIAAGCVAAALVWLAIYKTILEGSTK